MKDIRFADFSDIHLGHKNEQTLDILAALKREIFDSGLLKKIDILFFSGDIYDRILQLDYPALAEIDIFFSELIHRCYRENVKVRILEGTPSHDRGQPSRIVTIKEITASEVDLKYYDKLDIEYIEEFDCTVLYVPDEWRIDNADTLAEVKELLKSRGLKTVDIAIMHGQFAYQLPVSLSELKVHDSTEYQTLVKYLILIGHVHTHSRMGKIVAPGSFDRLKHGEPEAKGYVVGSIKNGRVHIDFIENKTARKYITVAVYDLDTPKSMERVEAAIAKAGIKGCIRIEADPTHPLFQNFHQLQAKWPLIVFSKLPKLKEQEVKTDTIESAFESWQPIRITSSNIKELVAARLKANKAEIDIDAAIELLGEHI